MVDLTFLGTGGGMPMPNRHLAALLINYKGRKILIDCGEGTQIWLREYSLGFKGIDLIIITHCHGDHINGLPGLLGTIGNSGREKDLNILGPKGIKDVVAGLSVTARYLPYKVNVIECFEDEISFNYNKEGLNISNDNEGDIRVNTLPLEHSLECIGISLYFNRRAKFDLELATRNNVPKEIWGLLQKNDKVILDGKEYRSDLVLEKTKRKGIKITYVTDSRPIESIISFIDKSDLFVCEGTYDDNLDLPKAIKNKHMTFEEGAKLAKKGGVLELIYTHYSPALINPEDFIGNGRSVFEKSFISYDGMKKELNFK